METSKMRRWTVDATNCSEFNRLVDILVNMDITWRMIQSGTETNVPQNIVIAIEATQFEAECIQEESFFVSEQ